MSLLFAASALAGGILAKFAYSFSRELVKTSRITGKSLFHYFYPGGFLPKMTKKEALLILDVRESASKEEVKQAFKKMMIQNHPDRGGSPYIAAKVTEAKEFIDNHLGFT
jgi:DnaJ family protein C protein 19